MGLIVVSEQIDGAAFGRTSVRESLQPIIWVNAGKYFGRAMTCAIFERSLYCHSVCDDRVAKRRWGFVGMYGGGHALLRTGAASGTVLGRT
jgi:hypothetical protein